MSKRVNNKKGNRAKRKNICGLQTKVRGRSHGDQQKRKVWTDDFVGERSPHGLI